jgi:aryl-alcohol dehydrogenase-like predicted oxidoreductase
VERTWRILDAVTEIADAHGALPGQVAIAWLLTRPTVASILLGARTAAQLGQNLAAEDLLLGEDEVARLTSVSAPGLPPYPYGMIERHCGVGVWRDLGTSS